MRVEGGPHGWLVVDKPLGLTSSRVVEQVRRATGGKAGHAGTLDPAGDRRAADSARRSDEDDRLCDDRTTSATAFAFAGASHAPPTTARARLVDQSPSRPSHEAIEAMLPRFVGTIRQAPPAYSAIKVNGPSRLRARQTRQCAPALAPRSVEISNCGFSAMPDPRPCRLRGARRQGNLYPRPCPRSRGGPRHVRAYRRTSPPFGRALHRKPSCRTGFHRKGRHISSAIRVSASDRDRAGRHPGVGLDGSRSRATAARAKVGAGRIPEWARLNRLDRAGWSARGTTGLWSRWPGSNMAAFARYGSSIAKGLEPMSITAERKQALITEYGAKEGDTGSPEVQVAILSERIRNLTGPSVDPQEGLPLAARPAGDGRAAAAAVGLPEAIERRDVTRR